MEMFAWTLRGPANVDPPTGSIVAVVANTEALLVISGRLGGSAAIDLDPFHFWLIENLCTEVVLDADQVVALDFTFLTVLIDISATVRANGGQLRVRGSSLAFTKICAAAALNANLESTRA